MGNSIKLKITPIAIVAVCAVIALFSLVTIIKTADRDVKTGNIISSSNKAKALCESKYIYTEGQGSNLIVHYVVGLRYDAMGVETHSKIDSTSDNLKNLDINNELRIYYNRDNTSECYLDSEIDIISPGPYLIWTAVLIAAMVPLVLNTRTILRNRSPYVSKLEKYVDPENEGTYNDGTVDPNADNGLSDMSIDYSAKSPNGNNPMDSIVDPFATYSGYEDDSSPADPVSAPLTRSADDINNPFPNYNSAPADINNPPQAPVDDDINNPFPNYNQAPPYPYGAPQAQQGMDMNNPFPNYNTPADPDPTKKSFS